MEIDVTEEENLNSNRSNKFNDCEFVTQYHHLSVLREILAPMMSRQWNPTPVLLPGNSHGWRSLVGCSPWGR